MDHDKVIDMTPIWCRKVGFVCRHDGSGFGNFRYENPDPYHIKCRRSDKQKAQGRIFMTASLIRFDRLLKPPFYHAGTNPATFQDWLSVSFQAKCFPKVFLCFLKKLSEEHEVNFLCYELQNYCIFYFFHIGICMFLRIWYGSSCWIRFPFEPNVSIEFLYVSLSKYSTLLYCNLFA